MNNEIIFYKFQYGEEDSAAFIVQIIWGELWVDWNDLILIYLVLGAGYPNECPAISLDLFYNQSMFVIK